MILLRTLAMLVDIAWTLACATLAVALPAGSLEARWANVSTAVVDLGYAQYQGTYDPDTNISYFFGIRYAQAPTGQYRQYVLCNADTSDIYQGNSAGENRRHRRSLRACSRRLLSRTDVTKPQLATQAPTLSGLRPSQRGTYHRMRTVSSSSMRPFASSSHMLIDVHVLSIYTPGELQPNASLPVLVWIHGGGLVVCLLSGNASHGLTQIHWRSSQLVHWPRHYQGVRLRRRHGDHPVPSRCLRLPPGLRSQGERNIECRSS